MMDILLMLLPYFACFTLGVMVSVMTFMFFLGRAVERSCIEEEDDWCEQRE